LTRPSQGAAAARVAVKTLDIIERIRVTGQHRVQRAGKKSISSVALALVRLCTGSRTRTRRKHMVNVCTQVQQVKHVRAKGKPRRSASANLRGDEQAQSCAATLPGLTAT
jgi:hypothetical protein